MQWLRLVIHMSLIKFDVMWCVINFDMKVFYKDEGILEDLKVSFSKKNGKICFGFVGDSSLGYVHDLDDYMQLLTRQMLVTPHGRVYVIEKAHNRCGNLFIKYTYCQRQPENLTVDLTFAYWQESRMTVIATWEYPKYYTESKLKTSKSPRVAFKHCFPGSIMLVYVFTHLDMSGEKTVTRAYSWDLEHKYEVY